MPPCFDNWLYVPLGLRLEVLEWEHSSQLVCHPGIEQTYRLLHQRFWLPPLEDDVLICNQQKDPCQALEWLLQTLPVPHHPWPHLSVDFVTRLPCPVENTFIDTVVNEFSKMVYFVPLPKLPSAKESAQLLVQHVFRLHGLPVDVVSDRGALSSTLWIEFSKLLGATSCLSSGFHPQSNGQLERKN